MGDDPSLSKGDDKPVERVSWNDVQEFINRLNKKEGTNKYRFPPEAEWEYGCRAGKTTRYSFGNDEEKLGEYGCFNGNSGGKTHPVGKKKPNPWSLHDMHGNGVRTGGMITISLLQMMAAHGKMIIAPTGSYGAIVGATLLRTAFLRIAATTSASPAAASTTWVSVF